MDTNNNGIQDAGENSTVTSGDLFFTPAVNEKGNFSFTHLARGKTLARAALDGTLASVASATDPHFGMQVPSACPDVPGDVLNPKNTWKDKKAYDSAARDVAQRFEANFQQFESHVDGKVKKAAIRAAA